MAQEQDGDNPQARLRAATADNELALLGAALTNQSALDVAAPFVDASDFGNELHSLIWQTMVDAHREGQRLTPMLVKARISSPQIVADVMEAYGVPLMSLLARIAAEATTVINAPDYAKVVREFRHRRDLNEAASRMVVGTLDPRVPLRDVASECSTAIEQALNISEPPRRSMVEIIRESTRALDENYVAPGVTTGRHAVDRMIGGFVPGDLIVSGGRPSMGKSATGLGLAVSSALQSYRRVRQEIDEEPWGLLFMTHEMTHEQVIQRCLTDLQFSLGDSANPVNYSRFRPAPGQRPEPLTINQVEGMRAAAALLPKLPLVIDGRPGMKLSEFTACVRQHKKKFAAKGIPLKVVTADHIGMGKIVPDKRHDNMVHAIGEITTGLKALAVNEGLCVNALHQLSRANEGRENKRPSLADFRDSGHIEQDADVMVGLYRDAYYLERAKEAEESKEQARRERLESTQHQLEFFVLKNRQGTVGMVELWAHMGANAIRDFGYGRT